MTAVRKHGAFGALADVSPASPQAAAAPACAGSVTSGHMVADSRPSDHIASEQIASELVESDDSPLRRRPHAGLLYTAPTYAPAGL